MYGEAFINRSAAPNPWVLFLAIYVLSVPLLVLGSLTNARLMPGLPLSALMFVSTAAVAFWVAYRTGGRAGLRALLGRVFDVAAIPEPGLGLTTPGSPRRSRGVRWSASSPSTGRARWAVST